MEEKLPFLYSQAIVALERLEILFQKLQRRRQNTSQKASAIERQVFWGTAKVYSKSQPVKFGLITVEIKLSRSN